MKLTIDDFLKHIEEHQLYCLTKDSTADERRHFNKLKAFGLIEESGNSWGYLRKVMRQLSMVALADGESYITQRCLMVKI